MVAGANAGIEVLTQAAAAAIDTHPSSVTPVYDQMLDLEIYKETQIQETLALAALIKTFQESVQKNSKE